jgi:hypothetical protein
VPSADGGDQAQADIELIKGEDTPARKTVCGIHEDPIEINSTAS